MSNNYAAVSEAFGGQTYIGFPSTSVTVKCFFKSACLTSMSLSSGMMASILERKTKDGNCFGALVNMHLNLKSGLPRQVK